MKEGGFDLVNLNGRFGSQTFAFDSNSSLADSQILFLPFSYPYALLAASCWETRCSLCSSLSLSSPRKPALQSGGLLPAKSTTPAPPPALACADLRRARGGGRPWMGRGHARQRNHEAPAPSQGRTTNSSDSPAARVRRDRRVKGYLAIDQGSI
jgi:hypothetical protein